MAPSRSLMLFAAVALASVCLTAATEHLPRPPPRPAQGAPAAPGSPMRPPAPPKGTTVLQAAVEEQGGFNSMYFGILVSFVILWTIYLFLYFFETGYAGDSYFWLSSYGTLVFLIALGLSKYFTASILAAVLAMVIIFIPITAAGFMAMESISSPDRFEGDKSNMGRTRLEAGM